MSKEILRIGVLGASGFVGRAVAERLRADAEVVALAAPRLAPMPIDPQGPAPVVNSDQVDEWARRFAELDVVINAAGDPNASSMNEDALLAANAVMPLVAYKACAQARVRRFIHISSAVVQGDRPTLDASRDWRPFSSYSLAKMAGEKWLLEAAQESTQLVLYRPPSVHAPGRGVTEKVSRLAAGPARSVAGAGNRPTPQALLENVADAVRFLAVTDDTPPEIVHHPWEGLTTAELMRSLGGRNPRQLPEAACSFVSGSARLTERVIPRLAPYRRRLEMMWFGQGVEPSWLSSAGWEPAHSGVEAWSALTTSPHGSRR